MAKIKHINCPRCGGTLGLSAWDRLIKCRYCGTWSLVDAPGLVPEYYLRPRLREVDARRKLQKQLMDPDMPPGLLRQARFHSAKLYFIPYHELSGRRLGTMTMTQLKEVNPSRHTLGNTLSMNVGSSYGGPIITTSLREENLLTPRERTTDTRVVMGDVFRLESAVRLEEWCLDQADIERLRTELAATLVPMDRRALERAGVVYDPSLDPDHLLNQLELKAKTAWLEDNTRIEEIRLKRIFYPIYRVRYRFQGRLYGSTIDGVTGKVMTARAPQDDRKRVLWLLASSALVSFFGGKLAAGVLGSALHDPQSLLPLLQAAFGIPVLLIALILIGLIVVLIIMGIGWEQFRYPGEIVIRGREREVIKINRPEKTVFDLARQTLEGMLSSFLKFRGASWRRGG